MNKAANRAQKTTAQKPSTTSANATPILLSLCSDASRQVSALENMLQQEKQILLSKDPSPLHELQQEKQRLLASLELFLKKRGELLNSLGYTANNNGWQKWQQEKLQSNGDQNLCSTLEESFKRCQVLNETNGKAIARQQQTVQKLLSIVRGQRPSQNELYTSRGQVASNNASGSPIQA